VDFRNLVTKLVMMSAEVKVHRKVNSESNPPLHRIQHINNQMVIDLQSLGHGLINQWWYCTQC